jgi:hypothetical protein
MSIIYNVYCDESCHMEHDGLGVMVLGAIWCRMENAHRIAEELRSLKIKHSLSKNYELKWTKVSPGKIQYYLDVIDYFLSYPDLYFRAMVVPDKSQLNHVANNQTHDEWYYKMYHQMLEPIIKPADQYRIYLDTKDSRGAEKVKKLHEILCAGQHDFTHATIERMQILRSHEVEQFQLVDLLIGAVAYSNRNLDTSSAKLHIIKLIEERSGYSLTNSTPLSSTKINLLKWQPAETL